VIVLEKKLQKFILNLYKKFNSESGFALVTVLMVFSILVVLGMSYVTMTINEIKQSESHNNKVQAYYYPLRCRKNTGFTFSIKL